MAANVDKKIVAEVERLLAGASMDTRAAVAAVTLPGRIRAFSAHYAALVPADQIRLARGVDEMMTSRGSLLSITGISAALAINWCEKRNVNYSINKRGDAYEVSIQN